MHSRRSLAGLLRDTVLLGRLLIVSHSQSWSAIIRGQRLAGAYKWFPDRQQLPQYPVVLRLTDLRSCVM